MKRFAAVALREIVERRFVLVAAAVAAVVPFLVALLPGVPGSEASEARSVTALVLAFTFGFGGSLLIGASVVGSELAEKRLSFHFSRPISGPVIWFGKLVGGLVVVLLAEAIVVLPTAAVIQGIPTFGDVVTNPEWLRGLFLVPAPLFLIAWMSSVALRSRSPWLVIDAALAVALSSALFLIGRRFVFYGGRIDDTNRAILTVFGVFLAAALAGTLAQVVAGRTDGRRGHGAQSLAFWGVLFVVSAAGAAWAERTIDPGVDRLVRAWAQPACPNGNWAFVQGSARQDGAGRASYLLNLRSGRSHLLPLAWAASVSADGSRAAYVHMPLSRSKEVELKAIDLMSGDSVALVLPEWPDGVALAADGLRVAVVSGGVCQVIELPSLRLLASARLPSEEWAYAPRFVTPDVVRLHPYYLSSVGRARDRREGEAIEAPFAADLDVPSRSLKPLVTYRLGPLGVPVDRSARYPIPSLVLGPNGSRVLATGYGSLRGVGLFEAASGQLLATVDGASDPGKPSGAFLADGRVVFSEPSTEGRRLALLSPDGVRLSEIPLPGVPHFVRFGPEPGKGLLCIGLSSPPGTSSHRTRWYLASLADGTLRPFGDLGLEWPVWQGSHHLPPPGSPATRLALEKDTGRLVLYDPSTGATTPLTRGRPSGK